MMNGELYGSFRGSFSEDLAGFGWEVPWVEIIDKIVEWIKSCLNNKDAFIATAQDISSFSERRIERQFTRELRREGLRGGDLRTAAYRATDGFVTRVNSLSEQELGSIHDELFE